MNEIVFSDYQEPISQNFSQNNQNLDVNQNLEDNQNLNDNQNGNDNQNLLLTQELEEKKKKLIQCYAPVMLFIFIFEVLLGRINLDNISSKDYDKMLILFISSCFISFIMILPLLCITVKSNIPQILFILFIKAILVIILVIIGSNYYEFNIYYCIIPPFIFIILSITFECQKSKLEK